MPFEIVGFWQAVAIVSVVMALYRYFNNRASETHEYRMKRLEHDEKMVGEAENDE